MFDQTVLRRTKNNASLTVGMLAEALLFYQHTHLFLDRSSLIGLLHKVRPEILMEVLELPNVTATYTHEMLVCNTSTIAGLEVHDLGTIAVAGKPNKILRGNREKIVEAVSHANVFGEDARKFAAAFCEHAEFCSYLDSHFIEGGIPNSARQGLDDPVFVNGALQAVLAGLLKEDLIIRPTFNVMRTDADISLADTINWPEARAKWRGVRGDNEVLNPAHLLAEYQDAFADLVLASHYRGDFMTGHTSSRIAQLRFVNLLRLAGINTTQQEEFTDVVLEGLPSLRDVIDSGDRTLEEFLKILPRAAKFREFVGSVNPDSNLVREYFAEATKEGWISSLGVRAARFAICRTAGLVGGTKAGLAASLADTLLFNRIVAGWRPNHFVDNMLVPFLDKP